MPAQAGALLPAPPLIPPCPRLGTWLLRAEAVLRSLQVLSSLNRRRLVLGRADRKTPAAQSPLCGVVRTATAAVHPDRELPPADPCDGSVTGGW